MAEPGLSPGALFPGSGLSLGAGDVPGKGCSKSCPRAVPGARQGGGRKYSTLATWRETETLGKCLLNELLCEIQEKPFPAQKLQLSGTSPGK